MYDQKAYDTFINTFNIYSSDGICPFCKQKYNIKYGLKNHIKYHFGYVNPQKNCSVFAKPDPISNPKQYDKWLKMHEKSSNTLRYRIANNEIIYQSKNLTDDIKIKISKSMKSAHKEGRAHNIGTSRWNNKPSYPEKFFINVIKTNLKDQNYQREYTFHKYSFDFAWPHQKKYLEIDGDQHIFLEQQKRDNCKDSLAIKEGWIGLRFLWKDVCKHPHFYINKLQQFIDGTLTLDDINVLVQKYNIALYEKANIPKTFIRDINKAHEIALKVNLLIDSNIQIYSYGWTTKVKKLLGIKHPSKWIICNANFLIK